jgi:plasmid maintenance system killer protein
MDSPGSGCTRSRANSKVSAVTVRANWRVVFRLREGNALEVDYVDYH